jgi:UDP-glucose 4-epimerase
MCSVLVTGAAGFIGAYAARAIAERDEQVVGLDVASETADIAKILAPVRSHLQMIRGSISDEDRVHDIISKFNVSAIVHTAAISEAQKLLNEPRTALEINTLGTLCLLEAARANKIGRMVHISSIAAFGAKRYEPLDEHHPVLDPRRGHPAGFYGASKAAAEMFGLAYVDNYGLDLIVLRPAGVYGYGMKVPMYIKPMVENAVAGQPSAFPTGGSLRRNFVYIKDCVTAILCSLDADSSKLQQRIFLVAEGRQHRIAEAAEIVRKHLPGSAIQIGDELTPYEKERAAASGELDITAARFQLGFSPRYDLETGLLDYIETYRQLETKEAQR